MSSWLAFWLAEGYNVGEIRKSTLCMRRTMRLNIMLLVYLDVLAVPRKTVSMR